MKDWFLSLTRRERIIIQVAALVITVFFSYLFVVEPVSNNYAIYKKNVVIATETLDWMKTAQREVKQLGGEQLQNRQPGGKQLILGVVEKSIRNTGLATVMKRIQPEGDSGLRVWFENASFDKLIIWLEMIESKHGLLVNEINVEQTDSAGLVNVRMFLAL